MLLIQVNGQMPAKVALLALHEDESSETKVVLVSECSSSYKVAQLLLHVLKKTALMIRHSSAPRVCLNKSNTPALAFPVSVRGAKCGHDGFRHVLLPHGSASARTLQVSGHQLNGCRKQPPSLQQEPSP